MVDIHFIDNEIVLEVINSIISIAGQNFNVPYDASVQPSDAISRNTEELIQFQLPAGGSLQGYADASISESMGTAINSMLAALAPFMAAFGLILPILGIIRGIIEVLCALINPWAVIKAIIRLFTKWIPPFISLFPPMAGVVIIISIIKAIIALVFYVLTVIVPMIQLIKYNIESVFSLAFGPDGNEQQQEAGKQKLLALIAEILNQLGALAALKPILDIVFLILGMVAGFPCDCDESGCKPTADLTGINPFHNCDEDCTCCNDDTCPPILKNPPKGKALLIPTYYSDSPQFFAWQLLLVSGASKLNELKPYMQNFTSQLNEQLDEPIDEAKYARQQDDSSHFKVKITSRRGGNEVIVPLVKIGTSVLIVVDPTLQPFTGSVNYEIITNWEMLIKNSIVGLGCHPEVAAAKALAKAKFPDLGRSVLDRFPTIAAVRDDFNKTTSDLNRIIKDLRECVREIINSRPPFDTSCVDEAQFKAVGLLSDYIDNLKGKLSDLLGAVDIFNTGFDVNKNIVKAGAEDKAIITVTPKDAAGAKIMRGMPEGVDLNLKLNTDFGIITNQQINRPNGTITAEIESLTTGTANITAQVNSEYLAELLNTGDQKIRVLQVSFVADGILPKRRLVSKTGKGKTSNAFHDRSPGN